MTVSVVSGSFAVSVNWNVQATNTGAAATTNAGSYTPKLSFTNGTGAGNANDFVSVINTLAGGANTTLDLTSSFPDLVGTSALSINTVRSILIWLLSTAQTGPDGSTVGTASSSITIGNAATVQAFTAAAPNGLIVTNTSTLSIPNGGYLCFGVGSAGGFTAGASYKNLKVVNADGSNTATYAVCMFTT